MFSASKTVFLMVSATGLAIKGVSEPVWYTASSWRALVAATYKSFTLASHSGYAVLSGFINIQQSNSNPFVYVTGKTIVPLSNCMESKSLTKVYSESFFAVSLDVPISWQITAIVS